MPKPTQEELIKINKMTMTPLTEENCYVFNDLMIDDQVTSYSSRIHQNLLRKFVKDTNKGIGLLMSHDSGRLPVGRSYDAHIKEDYDEDSRDLITSVYGSFYIDLGRNTETNMSTDDIAKGIDSGTIFDTSVGFSADKWDCSICDNDVRSWECAHYPGNKYVIEREGEDGTVNDEVETCVIVIGSDGVGEVIENSLVYAGACGRATIVNNFSKSKVNEKDKGTKLQLIDNLKEVPLDATIYQYCTDDGSAMYYNRTGDNGEGSELTNRRGGEELEKAKFDEVLDKFGLKADSPEGLSEQLTEMQGNQEELTANTEKVVILTEELATANTELTAMKTSTEELTAKLEVNEEVITELTTENEELSVKAEVAETYRQDLCTKALESGVRAQGNAFNKELYSKFLDTLSIDEVKEVTKGFDEEVSSKFSGAKTTETKEPTKDTLGKGPTSREDFETEVEFREFVADKAIKFAKENDVSIKDATKEMYAKYKEEGSGE